MEMYLHFNPARKSQDGSVFGYDLVAYSPTDQNGAGMELLDETNLILYGNADPEKYQISTDQGVVDRFFSGWVVNQCLRSICGPWISRYASYRPARNSELNWYEFGMGDTVGLEFSRLKTPDSEKFKKMHTLTCPARVHTILTDILAAMKDIHPRFDKLVPTPVAESKIPMPNCWITLRLVGDTCPGASHPTLTLARANTPTGFSDWLMAEICRALEAFLPAPAKLWYSAPTMHEPGKAILETDDHHVFTISTAPRDVLLRYKDGTLDLNKYPGLYFHPVLGDFGIQGVFNHRCPVDFPEIIKLIQSESFIMKK